MKYCFNFWSELSDFSAFSMLSTLSMVPWNEVMFSDWPQWVHCNFVSIGQDWSAAVNIGSTSAYSSFWSLLLEKSWTDDEEYEEEEYDCKKVKIFLHWSVKIFFEEDKEESLNEAVHRAADEHHDEEEEDLQVGQDRLQSPHRVLWLWQFKIHVNLKNPCFKSKITIHPAV